MEGQVSDLEIGSYQQRFEAVPEPSRPKIDIHWTTREERRAQNQKRFDGGLAFLPMRLLLTHISANIQQFVLRQRERRVAARETPERRKESESPGPA